MNEDAYEIYKFFLAQNGKLWKYDRQIYFQRHNGIQHKTGKKAKGRLEKFLYGIWKPEWKSGEKQSLFSGFLI